MGTSVHIGDKVTVDEQAVEARTEAIISVLEAGANYNTDEETLRHALDKLQGAGRTSGPDGATIRGCTFNMTPAGPEDLNSEEDEDDDGPRPRVRDY